MAHTPSFATLVGDALRAVRYARGLSQRALAADLGVGKSTVARLESGDVSAAVALVQVILDKVGFEVTLVDRRPPSGRAPSPPACPHDPEADEIVAFWRERASDEEVRDASGRRPPAHRHVYPLAIPHTWWTARHPLTPWVLRPTWSWSRYVTWSHVVRRDGRYPRWVGHPPRGGAPMQGYPPMEMWEPVTRVVRSQGAAVSPGLGR